MASDPVAHPRTAEPLRFRVKPSGPPTGYVDGGWWPRTRDLTAELPALLAELAERLGRVDQVSYNLSEWGPTVGKITVGGRGVQFGGFHSQHAGTVDMLGAERRVTLLVVSPETNPDQARRALTMAGERRDVDRIEDLLATQVSAPAGAAS